MNLFKFSVNGSWDADFISISGSRELIFVPKGRSTCNSIVWIPSGILSRTEISDKEPEFCTPTGVISAIPGSSSISGAPNNFINWRGDWICLLFEISLLIALKDKLKLSIFPVLDLTIESANSFSVKNILDNFVRFIDYKIEIFNEKRRLGDPSYILSNNKKIKKKLKMKFKKSNIENIILGLISWKKLNINKISGKSKDIIVKLN